MPIVERPLLATPERVPTFDATGCVLRISAGMLFFGVGLTKFNPDELSSIARRRFNRRQGAAHGPIAQR